MAYPCAGGPIDVKLVSAKLKVQCHWKSTQSCKFHWNKTSWYSLHHCWYSTVILLVVL